MRGAAVRAASEWLCAKRRETSERRCTEGRRAGAGWTSYRLFSAPAHVEGDESVQMLERNRRELNRLAQLHIDEPSDADRGAPRSVSTPRSNESLSHTDGRSEPFAGGERTRLCR